MLERIRNLPDGTRKLILWGVPALLVVVIAGVAIALSGGEEPVEATTTTVAETTTTEPEETTTTTEPEETTTTVVAGPPSPLNGLPVDDEALLDRRVMAVKIDNHALARPQSGIDRAEVVYELLVEGGLTRFIALFHHSDADYLGPIRSGRPTDPTLVANTGGPLVVSGAQGWVQARIRAAGVSLIGEVRPGTYRIADRDAPHNLYGDTAVLRTDHADALGYPDEPPAAPLFTWGEILGDRATDITFDWSSDQPSVRWAFQGGEYLRFTGANAHMIRDEDEVETQLSVDTLVVLEAPRYDACPPAGASGSCVPALETVGTGRALVFNGGMVQEGTWERSAIDQPFELTADDGTELAVPAGRLWINVFPAGRDISW